MTENTVIAILGGMGSIAILFMGLILGEIRGMRKDITTVLIKTAKHDVKISSHDSRICSLEKLSELRQHS